MNTPEFDNLVNHYTACTHCRPRHDVYCNAGRNLWIDDKAGFIANLSSKALRQYWIADMQKYFPQYIEQIKKRVLEIFEAKK